MFRFNREKILPVFLKKEMTIADLSRKAGVAHRSAERAVEGEAVAAPIINKIADALGIDAMEFLDGKVELPPKPPMTVSLFAKNIEAANRIIKYMEEKEGMVLTRMDSSGALTFGIKEE